MQNIFLFFFSFYGSSQVRGWIGVAATGLHHSHHNTRSKSLLRLTLQLVAMLDPSPTEQVQGWNLHPHGHCVGFLTHWATMGTLYFSIFKTISILIKVQNFFWSFTSKFVFGYSGTTSVYCSVLDLVAVPIVLWSVGPLFVIQIFCIQNGCSVTHFQLSK